jgi:hypothetical protein
MTAPYKCPVCRDTGWTISRMGLATDPIARDEHVLVRAAPSVVPCPMHAPFCTYAECSPTMASIGAYAACGQPRPPKPDVADLTAAGF